MNAIMLPTLAALLTAAAVLLIAFAVTEQRSRARMRHTLQVVLGDPHAAGVHGGGPSWSSRATAMDEFVNSVGARIVGDRGRQRLRRHLAWAGKSSSESLTSIIGRKLIYLVVGLCLGGIVGLVYGGWWWLALPLAGAVGFYLPDLILFNQAEHRTEEIRLRLPDALDLLDLCVESGLGLQSALARVAQTQDGPVAAEFGRVLQEMQLGVARSTAFESMANRTNQIDLQRFVAAMLQVDKLGIPVASVLREQARDMRAARHARAREQAQKVPVKILMPLMVCFLPGLFIIILGPAVVTALSIFSGR